LNWISHWSSSRRLTLTHACYVGHQYQGFDCSYNYIANNDAEYRNIIAAFGIQLNFTMNIVYANRAQCILNASVLEKVSWGSPFLVVRHLLRIQKTEAVIVARKETRKELGK
jgi:hypothetical protein